MKQLKKFKNSIIGCVREFDGVFKLYQTDNIFRFLKQTKKDKTKDIGTMIRYGRIQPIVKMKTKGVIVGMLNKKEGLFVCKEYPLTVFSFPLDGLKL